MWQRRSSAGSEEVDRQILHIMVCVTNGFRITRASESKRARATERASKRERESESERERAHNTVREHFGMI